MIRSSIQSGCYLAGNYLENIPYFKMLRNIVDENLKWQQKEIVQ